LIFFCFSVRGARDGKASSGRCPADDDPVSGLHMQGSRSEARTRAAAAAFEISAPSGHAGIE
jgi:hypothetical protein